MRGTMRWRCFSAIGMPRALWAPLAPVEGTRVAEYGQLLFGEIEIRYGDRLWHVPELDVLPEMVERRVALAVRGEKDLWFRLMAATQQLLEQEQLDRGVQTPQRPRFDLGESRGEQFAAMFRVLLLEPGVSNPSGVSSTSAASCCNGM